MFRFLRSIFSAPASVASTPIAESPREPLPALVAAPGVAPFDFADALRVDNGLPAPDWDTVRSWIDGIPNAGDREQAWSTCQHAWLLHLGAALGDGCRLRRGERVLLLGSLDDPIARATVDFMARTRTRILRVLDGIASASGRGSDILIVVDDDETYYRHVGRYYHDDGEFAASGGMHIDAGCGHFVTRKGDLHAIEPIIAHEMTHGCVGHLPLPAWLNEGIAVNTEQRLCPPPPPRHCAREMHAKHRGFWGPAEIQSFWSGRSFLRTDDGNMLSYDLARILVEQFAGDWPRFRAFVLAATLDDAGAAAAERHLGVALGAAVAAILEQAPARAWHPAPQTWTSTPERGAFHGRSRIVGGHVRAGPWHGFAPGRGAQS